MTLDERADGTADRTAIGAAGADCLSLWQAGDELEVVHDTLDNSWRVADGDEAAWRHPSPGGAAGRPLYYDT